jgi:hypothetical protein
VESVAYLPPGIFSSMPVLIPIDEALQPFVGPELDLSGTNQLVRTVYGNGDPYTEVTDLQPIEVAESDRLRADVGAPGLVWIKPEGELCGTSAVVSAQVVDFSGTTVLAVNGASTAIDGNGQFAASVPLLVGKHSFVIDAVNADGLAMTQERFLTRPLTVGTLESPAGGLVPQGETPPLPKHAVKSGATLPLRLSLASCGAPVLPSDVAKPPGIVSVTRIGAAAALSTVTLAATAGTPGSEFQYVNGAWQHNFKTAGLAAGSYLVTIEMPDGSFWDTQVVVK